MKFEIPSPLRADHAALDTQLKHAMEAKGAVGAAAREVARLVYPHFQREKEFALPPLGLLADVVRGALRTEMHEALAMTRKLKAELPAMFDEHRQIVEALQKLSQAAHADGRREIEQFAAALAQHAEMEERVLYPAAVLLGEHLARALDEAPVL